MDLRLRRKLPQCKMNETEAGRSSAKKNDNEILMKYRTRSHAWENFFMRSGLSVRRKRALASLGKAALSIASGAFAGFLVNIADDTSSTNQVKDARRWRKVKDVRRWRNLKSFKSVIEEFREHVLQCISKQKKLTDVARKFAPSSFYLRSIRLMCSDYKYTFCPTVRQQKTSDACIHSNCYLYSVT
ncbi:Hypothetical predicted protein [Octopus vulgaris]|uniref:Uncharacterized protein n=1 Tax=Octopus vulgaris TaxID=6645 RepID=A0AA36FD52_OCTVU|nr:Hypothetical predicted protein [Octopus vulgaris]